MKNTALVLAHPFISSKCSTNPFLWTFKPNKTQKKVKKTTPYHSPLDFSLG
jgi:hypothetical protein